MTWKFLTLSLYNVPHLNRYSMHISDPTLNLGYPSLVKGYWSYNSCSQIAPLKNVYSKKIGVPALSKLAHDIWCAVHTLFMVCIAHLIWCVMHTIFGVENTLCTVCYYIAFCPGLAFTHVNMYNIDTIQLQSSHEQYSKCVVLLSIMYLSDTL